VAKTKYSYNPKTLRYERSKISAPNVILYVLSLLVFGFLFFCAFIFSQNYLINTSEERALRDENEALEAGKDVLLSKLESIQSLLQEIKQSESNLHQKLFDATIETPVAAEHNSELLLAGAGDFNENISSIYKKLETLLSKAQIRSNYYYLYASVDKSDVRAMTSLPAIIPVEGFDYSKLVSGFGTRINPWHKGKYHHDGIDLAAARNTKVLAAGSGQVINTKYSELKAGFGNYIEIDHGYGFVTRYAHLGDILVNFGQRVNKGQPIATIGMSGGSIAPHVHYEVIKNGININPLNVFVEGLNANEFYKMAESGRKLNQSLD
jgi:murein DD-endopeptidase MepM/ murein hydrolase activator NlpD